MGRARARPVCGGRGAVRPRGRGAARRGPLRETLAHGAGLGPAPASAHEGIDSQGLIPIGYYPVSKNIISLFIWIGNPYSLLAIANWLFLIGHSFL